MCSNTGNDTGPPCPTCGSASTTTPLGKRTIHRWECGAWANVTEFAEHGAAAVVDYDADCEWRVLALRMLPELVEYADMREASDQGVPTVLANKIRDAKEMLGVTVVEARP